MKPKKSLGQNFLINDKILNIIIKHGEIKKDDIILEIGPGTGKLTEKIIEKKPLKNLAIEKDKILSDQLKVKFGNKLEIINEDILKIYNKFKFDSPIKVFGNLPYNISTKILTSFINMDNLSGIYSDFFFIFQKEVADRIVAKFNTKQYGRISILTSWRMDKFKILDIPPLDFYPAPKVWSSLVIFKSKKNFEYLKKSQNLEHITNIFFNQRRKMIRKPFKQLFTDYERKAKKLNIDLNLRPQNLSVKNYIEICKLYENLT